MPSNRVEVGGLEPAPVYPRVYRAPKTHFLWVAAITGFACGGTAFAGAGSVVVAALAAAGAVVLWFVLRFRIVLYEDRLETTWGGVFRRLDFVSWRREKSGIILVPLRGQPAYISLLTELDPEFLLWLKPLENWREELRTRSATTPSTTSEERKALETGKKIQSGFLMAILPAFFLTIVEPQPGIGALLMAVLPWAAVPLFRKYPLLLRAPDSPGASVLLGIAFVACLHFLCATPELVAVGDTLAAGFAIAVAFCLGLVWASRRWFSVAGCILLFGVGLLHGCAVVAMGNRMLEHGVVRIERVRVVDKQVVKRRGTHKMLVLDPWSGSRTWSSRGVSPSMYDSVRPGFPVCLVIHRGGLGYEWLEEVQLCPQ